MRAVSPVIATIIIVAIAITMSIAVAYWLLGLGGSFTKFEKVEFNTAYAEADANGNFNVTMNLKNTGSATATILPDQILYNGKPATAYTTFAPVCNFTSTNIVMEPGQTACVTIDFDGSTADTNWVSGMTVEVTLHTTGGKDYPKAIIMP